MSKPKQAQCRCFSPRTNSDVRAGIYVAGARGNRGYYNSQNTYPVRDVCKRCKVMTADELVKKRELREIKQARDTAKGWGRCDICLKEFDKEGGKLDKFWVCGSECCGGECRWDGHKI